MAKADNDKEIAIQKASKAMDEDPTLTGVAAATHYRANYQRLMARRRGRPPSNSRGGHNKKLSTPQDSALKDYLLLLYHAGTPANLEQVILAANRLLFYAGSTDTVSRRWAKRWLDRQSEFFKTIKSKPMAAKRLASHVVEDVQLHFREFERCKNKWGILDNDISNFDETGFQIGVISGEKVIIPVDCQVAYQADPDNRELITSVETLNYGGQRVPSMIIFKGAYHLRKHFDNDLDGDTLFARSSTGFSNDRLALVYLKHFDRFTRESRKGKYRMLIFDGHGSHITQPFIDYCWENAIRPFLLPPHITHLLQPLDVGVFQSLKHNFKKVVRKEIFNGATEVSKADFFSFFQRFHDRTFRNPRIYQSAFRKTGLIPLNPELVLNKMKEYTRKQTVESTPPPNLDDSDDSSNAFATPPSPIQTTNWQDWPTPFTMRTRKKGVDYIQSRTEQAILGIQQLSPSVLRVQAKVEKASQTSILRGALSTHRLHDLSAAESIRRQRKEGKEGNSKIVQKYGEIYGRAGRRDIKLDEDEEKEVINMREKRQLKVWRSKWPKVMAELLEAYGDM
jgi:hypothetical protein